MVKTYENTDSHNRAKTTIGIQTMAQDMSEVPSTLRLHKIANITMHIQESPVECGVVLGR
jgi:hypothetical protein